MKKKAHDFHQSLSAGMLQGKTLKKAGTYLAKACILAKDSLILFLSSSDTRMASDFFIFCKKTEASFPFRIGVSLIGRAI
jgi:hypothetical protein